MKTKADDYAVFKRKIVPILVTVLVLTVGLVVAMGHSMNGQAAQKNYNVLFWTLYKSNDGQAKAKGFAADNIIKAYQDTTKIPAYTNGATITIDDQRSNTAHFAADANLASKYDMIILFLSPYDYTDNDVAALSAFLDAGGRIFMICEVASWIKENENIKASSLVERLGGGFSIDAEGDSAKINGFIPGQMNNSSTIIGGKQLAGNTGGKIMTYCYASISIPEDKKDVVEVIASNGGKALVEGDNGQYPVLVDQAIGKGRITVTSDFNWIIGEAGHSKYNATFTNVGYDTPAYDLLARMVMNSANNKAIVAAGGNPNAGFGADHGFEYSFNEITQTLTATCVDENCELHSNPLILQFTAENDAINSRADYVYNKASETKNNFVSFTKAELGTIQYSARGDSANKSTTAPTTVGDYTAYLDVTVGGNTYSFSDDFVIKKGTNGAAREPYTIGADGILPAGLLYGEIDYDTDFIEDVILYAKAENGDEVHGTYINLTTEEFVTDLDYTYYSINNGRSWTKATKKIDYKKLQSLLKKGFTLKLMKGTMVKSKPSEDSVIYSFEKINKRQKVSALKINYAIYSDYSGLTNGQWTVMVNGIEVNVAKYWFGIADETGKQIGVNGWGLWPYMDGVWIKDVAAGKQLKEKYLYKLPAYGNTPASVTKKVTVYGVAKASKTKVNYTYENLSLNKDYVVYYGEEIPDTRADKEKLITDDDPSPFEYLDAATVTTDKDKTIADYAGKLFDNNSDKPVKLLLSAYITDERNTIIIWKKATTTKPASEPQVIKLAARAAAADENTSFTIKSGALKFKIDKTLSFTYFEASTNNWKSVPPKVTANTILTIRAKNTAKGGKESDTTHATGYESYLVLEYGVANSKTGKMGVVSAKAFTSMEAAESYLAELNAAGQAQ